MMKLLSTQRILASLGMIVFVGALAAGATGAFFSDTETSTGNTFAAGEIDLKVDNSSYGFDWNDPTNENPTGVWGVNTNNSWALSDLTNQLFFSFADLKPGDFGEDTISLHVQNNAYACMRMDLTSTPDNGINEPEADADDETDGVDGGELQNFLSFMFWNDDGDNVYEVGETTIDDLTGLPGEIFTGDWLTIADSQEGIQLAAGTTTYIGKGWCFGTMTAAAVAQDGLTTQTPIVDRGAGVPSTGFTCDGSGDHNVAQTDGIVVDVEFYSVQSRNNGDFQCSSLNEGEPVVTTLTLAKAVNPPEAASDLDFILVADGPTDLSGAEGPGVTNVSVTPGVYALSESGGPGGETSIVLSCSGNATEETDNGNGTGSVTIAAGENVTCGWTNNYPVQTPSEE